MKRIFGFAAMAACLSLAACKNEGNTKKVMVIASGKVTIDPKDQKTIKIGAQKEHSEAYVTFSTGDKVTLNVQTASGAKAYEVADNGFYLLNLKEDTLVGGMQNLGGGGSNVLTQEKVQEMVDSLQSLIEGKNVSAEKHNYFIVPNSIQKISANVDAEVYGPFSGLPGTFKMVDGKMPEVYEFKTNTDAREVLKASIDKLKK